jgi:hypothetical protein
LVQEVAQLHLLILFKLYRMNVSIPLKEFIKEHKQLIPLLKKGSTDKRLKEANKQQKELLKVMKRYNK